MVPTIYVREPWSASSEAAVLWGSLTGALPPEAVKQGMTRLVEVDGAMFLLQDRYYEFSAANRHEELCSLLIKRVTGKAEDHDPYVHRRDDV